MGGVILVMPITFTMAFRAPKIEPQNPYLTYAKITKIRLVQVLE
jgi:hypothetical protein